MALVDGTVGVELPRRPALLPVEASARKTFGDFVETLVAAAECGCSVGTP